MAASAESDFTQRSDALLRALQTELDAFDPDELEADLAGGVLRIHLPGKRTCVLNRQAAVSQIWMAEGATAWHFAFDPAQRAWIDTKGRGELRRLLAEVLSQRLGRTIELADA